MISVGTVDLRNGETLCYRKAGVGEKILLLVHGNMSSSRHWEPVLQALPEAYTAYAVDLRGFGDSSYTRPIDSLGDFAQDLVEFCSGLNLANLTVVGWSTGGGVAMQMAAEHPELISALVLVESVSYQGYPIFKKDAQGQPLVGQHYANRDEMAADPTQVAPVAEALVAGNSQFMSYLWDMAIYPVNKPTEAENSALIEASMKQRNLVDVDWALASFNLGHSHNGVSPGSGLVDNITCPVLAFWGDKDVVVPRSMVEETVTAIGDNARLVVLADCGHSPLVDAPDKLMAELFAFSG